MNGSLRFTLSYVKRLAMLLIAAGLFFSFSDAVGQSTAAVSPPSQKDDTKQTVPPNRPFSGAEILSDTQGVDFGPYMRRAISIIKKNWIPLLPEEARSPASMQGETLIRFSISPEGKISAMHLDESSQNTKIDRAAWEAIEGVGQFPPLPTEFKGPSLEIRIDFLTNRASPAPGVHPPAIP